MMEIGNQRKKWAVLAGIVLILVTLQLSKKKEPMVIPVPCIIPNMPLLQHDHIMLQIVMGGTKRTVPKDIGIATTCETALHTHDTTGTVHVEAQDHREYTLGDFFRVWNTPLMTNGFLWMTVDGKDVKGDHATVIDSTVGEGTLLCAYAIVEDSEIGRECVVGSIVRNSKFGTGVFDWHLAGRIYNADIVDDGETAKDRKSVV